MVQINARYGWLFLLISFRLVIYLDVQQKQSSTHTKTGTNDSGGSGRGGNNLIDLILGPFAFPP